MFEKLKTELAAALILTTGILVGSGYLVTWFRLENENLPTAGILSALPHGFYLGVALENLLFPVVVLLTLGVGWLVATVRTEGHKIPRAQFWAGFGFALAVYTWVIVGGANPYEFASSDPGYWVATGIWAVAVVALTTALGAFGRWRLNREEQVKNADQLVAGGAAILLASVVATVAYLCIDARYKDRAFPQAAVFTDREDCREVEPTSRETPGCPLAGFYIGESDQWLFLIEDKRATEQVEIPAEVKQLPGRIFFVPRDRVRQLRLDEEL